MLELPQDGFFPDPRTYITISGRPERMPAVPEGQVLVCEYIRAPELPSFTRYFRIDTVEDMQYLYDACDRGGAIEIKWFFCDGGSLVILQRPAG